MKTVFTILALLLMTVSFCQTKTPEVNFSVENTKVTNFSVSVTVDSAQEVESTFQIKDIKDMLDEVENNEEVVFEIICNGDKMSNGEISTVSYRVTGNTKDITSFLKQVKDIRKAAIKYYKNKE